MADVLVLAIGNPLRGDDGVGWRAAQHLNALADGKALEVVTCHQLTPELAELMAGAQRAIFVDAAVDVPAGEVRCEAVHPGSETGGFSHHLTPCLLLSYTRSLFHKCPKAFQISIGGKSFGYSESLSEEARASFAAFIRTIKNLCSTNVD